MQLSVVHARTIHCILSVDGLDSSPSPGVRAGSSAPMSALLKPDVPAVDLTSAARRRRGAAHLLSPRRRLAALGRRADDAARRRPHHALPVEAGQGRAARPPSARAAVAPVRHLLVAADPLSCVASCRRVGAQAQQRADVRRPLGARPHAGRAGRRPVRRSPVPRRAARRKGMSRRAAPRANTAAPGAKDSG